MLPAVLAGSRLGAIGVEFCVLVERNGVRGVVVAENVATMPAVMTALEQRKGFLAKRGVANGSVGVGLPVVSCGKARDVFEGFFRYGLFLNPLTQYFLVLSVAR